MLPNKLTPIEEYFLLDDCPAYPMTVLVRLRLSGRLDRNAFESAVVDVVDRHPLLRAMVHVVGETKRWIECRDWQPQVDWDVDCDESAWPSASFIDVREEPGTRIRVVRRDEYDEVLLQVHHCCADAMGLCRLTEDLLIAYTQHYTAKQTTEDATKREGDHPPPTRPANEHGLLTPQPRSVNARRFRHRGMPGMPRWMFTMMAHRWRIRTRDCMTILKRKCSQLLPEKITGTSPPARETAVGNYPSLRIVRFDRRQTSRIVNVAKSKGVTVNSVLLRDLFLAIRDWRGELGVNRNDDMLRVCVPVNLRTWRDQDLTVTNSISLLFLDRNDEQMRCEKALLESIQDELHGKNRKDLRISFVTMLHVARHLPGGLKRFLAKRKCWSTCIFSSLGVLFRDVALPREDDQIVAANVRMEQWDLVPPMRDNLGLTICPYTYAGQLSMVLNYDPSRVDGDQLAVMLHTYLARLEASVGVNNGDFAGAASA